VTLSDDDGLMRVT